MITWLYLDRFKRGVADRGLFLRSHWPATEYQEATKDHSSHDHLILSTGGCPSHPSIPLKGAVGTPFIPLKGAPGTLFSWLVPLVTENPYREVATKDHFASDPQQGKPPDLKTKVGVSNVDVKGFPEE